MKIFIGTYLAYIKAAFVTLLCATTIFFISAGTRSFSIFLTGNSTVSIDILSITLGILIFSLIGFGIAWRIIASRNRRFKAMKSSDKETFEGLERQFRRKLYLTLAAQVFCIFFALSTLFSIAKFEGIGFKYFLLIINLVLMIFQVVIVIMLLFPRILFSIHSDTVYGRTDKYIPKTKASQNQSAGL